jgi:hypothetical protein
MVLLILNSVYGSEFENYTSIADSKVLTEKNIDLIYRGANPVRLISCIPNNFAGKLSEKIRNQVVGDLIECRKSKWQT